MSLFSNQNALATGAGIVITALGLGGCSKTPVASEDAKMPPAVVQAEPPPPAASQPANTPAPAAAVSFSKTMRGSLQESHDDSARNKFSTAVLDGTISQARYEIALKQNLAIFSCLSEVVGADQKLPTNVREHLVRDLNEVVAAFKKDLGLAPEADVADKDILASTVALQTMLREMESPHAAVCAYIDLGGNAFGTHDLAESLNEHGFSNTAGFTVYTRDKFMDVVRLMNQTFNDSSQFPALAEAGRSFYRAHGRVYESPEFDPK